MLLFFIRTENLNFVLLWVVKFFFTRLLPVLFSLSLSIDAKQLFLDLLEKLLQLAALGEGKRLIEPLSSSSEDSGGVRR